MKRSAFIFLTLAGLMMIFSGCGPDDPVAPDQSATQFSIGADPFDNVLKSTDGHTPADPQDRCDRLAEVLRLDDDQLAALSDAYMTFRSGMTELRTRMQGGEMTMDDARSAAVVLRDAFEAECQIILTAEQWDLLQDMRHEGQGDDRHHHGHHQHQGPGELWGEWMQAIDLDETQVAAVLEAFQVMRTGMQDLRDQVQDGTMTREDAFEAAGILRDDFDAALQTILTEEQYQALLELRPDCGGRQGR
jgi:hypothetical protein